MMDKRQFRIIIILALLSLFFITILEIFSRSISTRIDAAREQAISQLVDGMNKLKQDIGRNPNQREGLTLLSYRKHLETTKGRQQGYVDLTISPIDNDFYAVGSATGLQFIYYAGRTGGSDLPFIADKGKNNRWDVEEINGFPIYYDPYGTRAGDDILIRERGGIWVLEE